MRRWRPPYVLLGLVLLLVLAGVIVYCGRPQPAPRPHASPAPAATVSISPSASPSSKPTLRPPTIIVTPPPIASPDPGGYGKGKG